MLDNLFKSGKDDEIKKKILDQQRQALANKINSNQPLEKDLDRLNDQTADLAVDSTEFHDQLEDTHIFQSEKDDLGVPTDWVDNDMTIKSSIPNSDVVDAKKSHATLNKLLVIMAAVFLVTAGLVGAWLLQDRGGIIPENIIAVITPPTTIVAGEVMDFEFMIQNKNDAAISNAVLITRYGDFTASPKSESITRTEVGLINPQQNKLIVVPVVVNGSVGEQRKLDFELEYSPVNSSNRNAVEYSTDVIIERSPISLRLEVPDELTVGEQSEITLNLSTTDVLPDGVYNLVLDKSQDVDISFAGIESKQIGGQLSLVLPEFSPGKPFSISGTMTINRAVPGLVSITARLKQDQLTMAEHIAELDVILTPLVVTQAPKPRLSDAIESELNYTIQNTTDSVLRDVTVTASLQGEFSKVSSRNGRYNSATKVVSFNPSSESRLASIDPGERVELSIQITPVSVSGVSLSLKAFGFVGQATPDRRLLLESDYNYDTQSSVSGSAYATYRRSNVLNQGPLPPRVGQGTSYTINLEINLRDSGSRPIDLQAVLPENVSVLLSLPENVELNGRRITWRPSSNSDRASFQVILEPNNSQVGRVATLLENIILRYSDGYSQKTGMIETVTTDISRDSGYSSELGIVTN